MVRWTLPAKRDLKDIFDYIARDSVYYAMRVIDTLVERTEKLPDLPQTGRVVPEIDDAIVDGL